ncbi:transposase [Halomonas sp. QX-1]|uniref:Transposase n=2 Tax=Vreelandella TaxID=3137766 RepID=A0A7Y6RGW9_9GAMM|nr:transposase [Halomonas maris]
MNSPKRYSPEVRERGVRLVIEQQWEYLSKWAAICSIASKLGCTPETLRAWCKRTELTQENSSVNLSEHERLKQLERENTELKRAKEILRKAVAFFAQAELNRKPN